jgi:hypothetical protein
MVEERTIKDLSTLAAEAEEKANIIENDLRRKIPNEVVNQPIEFRAGVGCDISPQYDQTDRCLVGREP